jgi:hypothetical protein
MIYFVKNDLSLILDQRYKLEDKLLIYRKGRNVKSHLAVDFTAIDVSDEKKIYGLNKELFKLVDGVPKIHTITHLKARQAIADKKNAKQTLREERDEKLNTSTVTYDGSEFQTRPSDLINFTTMLTLLQNDSDTIVWTLADDTEKTITKADLHAIYLLGLQAGAMIDKEYRDAVRAL